MPSAAAGLVGMLAAGEHQHVDAAQAPGAQQPAWPPTASSRKGRQLGIRTSTASCTSAASGDQPLPSSTAMRGAPGRRRCLSSAAVRATASASLMSADDAARSRAAATRPGCAWRAGRPDPPPDGAVVGGKFAQLLAAAAARAPRGPGPPRTPPAPARAGRRPRPAAPAPRSRRTSPAGRRRSRRWRRHGCGPCSSSMAAPTAKPEYGAWARARTAQAAAISASR